MSAAEKLDLAYSVCGIHTHTGAVCERCRAHAVWLAEELANTVPYQTVIDARGKMAEFRINAAWLDGYYERPSGTRNTENGR